MGVLDGAAGLMQGFATNYITKRPMIILLQQAAIPSSMLISTLSAAPHAHHTLPADDTHRADELAKLQQAAKLMQPHFAGTRAECSNPAPR